MGEHDWLARRFEEDRPRLRAVAYRMLGSTGEAEDAVQEAWLRLARSDADEIENLSGWLTTVVSRVCLDAPPTRAREPSPRKKSPSREVPRTPLKRKSNLREPRTREVRRIYPLLTS